LAKSSLAALISLRQYTPAPPYTNLCKKAIYLGKPGFYSGGNEFVPHQKKSPEDNRNPDKE